jgi:NADH-quinone oxidoreductase subunit D
MGSAPDTDRRRTSQLCHDRSVDDAPGRLTVATSVLGAADPTDLVLDLGEHHPSAHGGLRIRLLVDGDTVVAAEPLAGAMHRGAEKLFEVRDYRQIIMLADRHDWLSAFANELGVVLAVERMSGLEVPERAVWLRTLLAELNRILSHLMFLGSYPPGMGDAGAVASGAHAARALLQPVLEEISGGRVHYMFNRVGGVKEDAPAGWTARVRRAISGCRPLLPLLDRLIGADQEFADRTVGVGVLDAATAAAYGVSGPAARAAGLDMDLRRDEPYLAYGQLDVVVVIRTAGDCHARFACLAEQVEVSLDLAERCLDRLVAVGGPVNVRLPKAVRAPEGHAYAWTENPSGINGYYLVSRGDRTPWRLALRTASYANVQALSAVLPGTCVGDLPAILTSLFFVAGDTDK